MFVDNEAGEADVVSVFIYSPFLYSGSYDLSYAAVKIFTSMSICGHIVSFFVYKPWAQRQRCSGWREKKKNFWQNTHIL